MYFRVQDIVARMSGCSYHTTARVLNALQLTCQVLDDTREDGTPEKFSAVTELLMQGCFDAAGRFTGFRSFPSSAASAGSDPLRKLIWKTYGKQAAMIKSHSHIDLLALEQVGGTANLEEVVS